MSRPDAADEARRDLRPAGGGIRGANAIGAVALWLLAVGAAVGTAGRAHAPTSHVHAGHHGMDGALLPWWPTSAVFAAWATMSVAMMMPTAVPMLRTLSDVLAARHARHDADGGDGARTAAWWAFLGAYTAVWIAVSAVLATAQAALEYAGVLGTSGTGASAMVTSAALLGAGAYQFMPLKARCLTGCARPMTFLLSNWRSGAVGALRMGLVHAATCVGCCWALMALALVGGVHSVGFMVVATVVMVIEKLPSIGERVRAPLGVTLVGVGVAAAVRALA